MGRRRINIETDLQPVSDFRANAAAVLRQVQDSGRPVVLTQRGRGAAVLLDVRTYEALIEENETLRDVLAGLDDVEAGRTVSSSEARQALLDRLAR